MRSVIITLVTLVGTLAFAAGASADHPEDAAVTDGCSATRIMSALAQVEGVHAQEAQLVRAAQRAQCRGGSPAAMPWPSGHPLSSELGRWHWPDGRTAILPGAIRYPSGRVAFANGRWYYPTSRIAFASGRWYDPYGRPMQVAQSQYGSGYADDRYYAGGYDGYAPTGAYDPRYEQQHPEHGYYTGPYDARSRPRAVVRRRATHPLVEQAAILARTWEQLRHGPGTYAPSAPTYRGVPAPTYRGAPAPTYRGVPAPTYRRAPARRGW